MKREFIAEIEGRGKVVLRRKIWNNQWVLTAVDLDRIYNHCKRATISAIRRIKDKMIEGTDCYTINYYEAKELGCGHCPKGIKLITESGYEKLVSHVPLFGDNIQIYTELIDNYFRLPVPENGEFETKEEINNAKVPEIEEETENYETNYIRNSKYATDFISEETPEEDLEEEIQKADFNFEEIIEQSETGNEEFDGNEKLAEENGEIPTNWFALLNKFIEAKEKESEKMMEVVSESLNLVKRMIDIMENGKSTQQNVHIVKNSLGNSLMQRDGGNYRNKTNNSNAAEYKGFLDYNAWKKEINDEVTKIMNATNPKRFKDRNAVLHEAYNSLKRQYGHCWDQYKKDYLNETENENVNTMELQYYIEVKNPACRNLLLSKLKTILNEELSVA